MMGQPYNHFVQAISAHSLLPISTRREQARANAKTSSSPVNIELPPTMSVDSPYGKNGVSDDWKKMTVAITDEIVHDATHMVRQVLCFNCWVIGEHLKDRHFRGHKQLRLSRNTIGRTARTIVGSNIPYSHNKLRDGSALSNKQCRLNTYHQ